MTPEQLQDGLLYAWKHAYSLRSIFRRLSRSRCLLPIAIPANLGYNVYARHLSRYTPDLMENETVLFPQTSTRHPLPDVSPLVSSVDQRS